MTDTITKVYRSKKRRAALKYARLLHEIETKENLLVKLQSSVEISSELATSLKNTVSMQYGSGAQAANVRLVQGMRSLTYLLTLEHRVIDQLKFLYRQKDEVDFNYSKDNQFAKALKQVLEAKD